MYRPDPNLPREYDGRDEVADESEERNGALHHALQPKTERQQDGLVVDRAVQIGPEERTKCTPSMV